MTKHGRAVPDYLRRPWVREVASDRQLDVSLSRRDRGEHERAGEER